MAAHRMAVPSDLGDLAPPAATWVWTVTSDRVAYSAAWHALLGDTRTDSVESLHAWLGRVHPDDVATVMQAIDKHLSGESSDFRCEHRLRARSGAFQWVVAAGRVARDAEGRAVRLGGTLEDVPERNRTDPLVGLPGLFALSAHVDRLITRARTSPSARFAVLLVDLDDFERLNATLGMDGGDGLLRDALRRLARCLREGDLVARLGAHEPHTSPGGVALPPLSGDECALVLSNLTDARDALCVAARLHDAMAAPFPAAGHRLFSSISVGIAMNSASHDVVEDLVRDAYSALVRAKARGRGESQLFDDSARADASEFWELASDLSEAVRSGAFEMWFQPIVNLTDGSLVRAEGLLRWRHAARGLLRPNIFVPLLEETGLIVAVGWNTIAHACQSLAAWRSVLPPAQGLRISVNLSPKQWRAPDLVPRLGAATRDAGLQPGDLELELAELDVMSNLEHAVQVSHTLRQAEFKVALDDFGLGLATTEHIRALGVHTLKIDRSYLGGNPQQGGSAAIVQYAIELAAILGLEVVAEGIETPTELQTLRKLGCPLGQGFLFSRAVPQDALLALLKQDATGGTDWWAGAALATTGRRRE